MNVGDVVLVRISGEPVYIFGTYDDGTLKVRRAVQTEDGIDYRVEGFRPGELQTEADRVQEEFDKQLAFYKMRCEADNLKRAYDEARKPKDPRTAGTQPEQLDLLN